MVFAPKTVGEAMPVYDAVVIGSGYGGGVAASRLARMGLRLAVLEPKQHQGHSLTGRIYCTPKALWRLSWFLRDFGYNTDLLVRDELDEKALVGLQGIVRVSHTVLNGHSFLNFDGFAPTADWEEFAPATKEAGQ